MNLPSIVIIILIFNLAVSTVMAVGITSTSGLMASNFNPDINTTATFSGVVAASQCSPGWNSLSCNPLIQAVSALWSTVLVFGYFMWGVIQILPQFAAALLLPGKYLTMFGVDSRIANMYTIAIDFLYAMWAYTLYTSRYNSDVT